MSRRCASPRSPHRRRTRSCYCFSKSQGTGNRLKYEGWDRARRGPASIAGAVGWCTTRTALTWCSQPPRASRHRAISTRVAGVGSTQAARPGPYGRVSDTVRAGTLAGGSGPEPPRAEGATRVRVCRPPTRRATRLIRLDATTRPARLPMGWRRPAGSRQPTGIFQMASQATGGPARVTRHPGIEVTTAGAGPGGRGRGARPAATAKDARPGV